MTRIRLFSAALAALLLCSSPTFAHPVGPGEPYVVTLEDEYGRTLRTFHSRGQTFVLGDYGDRYNIRVRNQTGRRIEAVVTVDGRDVVSGRVGDFVDERGYIINAHDSVLIEGFRKSTEQVAAFRFTNPSNSYSSKMGTPENVGVVGVAIFQERRYRPAPRRPLLREEDRYYNDYDYPREEAEAKSKSRGSSHRARQRSMKRSDPSAAAPMDGLEASGRGDSAAESRDYYAPEPNRNNLGTEYGEDRYSRVTEVHFRRANQTRPANVITLRYDDRQGLMARGFVVDRPTPVVQRYPQAFPRNRFAPPPPY